MTTRHGWSRIDVLVTLGVLGLFVGLVSTANAKNQLRSKQSTSTNNLKQLALGFHSHNDTFLYLPFNGGANEVSKLEAINYGWSNPNFRDSGTWATMLAPFIEQDALFRKNVIVAMDINSVPAWFQEKRNDHFWQVTVKIYNCPGRGRAGFKSSIEKGAYPGIRTDYAINVFINSPPRAYSENGYAKGVLEEGFNGDWAAANSKMTIQGIQDGSSNTILGGGKALPPALAKSNIHVENEPREFIHFAPIPAQANKDGTKNGDEGIFSPGNWDLKEKEKTLTSTGTARGHVVAADPPKETPKELPKDGGVPWMFADKDLEGKGLPAWHMAWGGPFETGVLFMFGDGSVRMIKYSQRGTVNFARMLYPADGNIVTID